MSRKLLTRLDELRPWRRGSHALNEVDGMLERARELTREGEWTLPKLKKATYPLE